jgi:hypothetical protein
MQTFKNNKNIIKFHSKSPKLTSEQIHPHNTTKEKKKNIPSLNSEKQSTIVKNLMD